MAYCADHHTLMTASADMTLLQWYLDDIPAIKHYTLKSRWPTKHAAMSMCWSSSHRLLYSGTTAGTIQGRIITRCEVDVAQGKQYLVANINNGRKSREANIYDYFPKRCGVVC